jgi:hypothetical protein
MAQAVHGAAISHIPVGMFAGTGQCHCWEELACRLPDRVGCIVAQTLEALAACAMNLVAGCSHPRGDCTADGQTGAAATMAADHKWLDCTPARVVLGYWCCGILLVLWQDAACNARDKVCPRHKFGTAHPCCCMVPGTACWCACTCCCPFWPGLPPCSTVGQGSPEWTTIIRRRPAA